MTVVVVPPTSTGGSGQGFCSCACSFASPLHPVLLCCLPLMDGSHPHGVYPSAPAAAITSYRVVGVPVNPAGGKNITLTGMGAAGAGTTRTFAYGAGSYVQGQQYRFYSYAMNVVGEGPPSAPIAPFTAPIGYDGFAGLEEGPDCPRAWSGKCNPPTGSLMPCSMPGAPKITAVFASGVNVLVNVTAPTSNGGSGAC